VDDNNKSKSIKHNGGRSTRTLLGDRISAAFAANGRRPMSHEFVGLLNDLQLLDEKIRDGKVLAESLFQADGKVVSGGTVDRSDLERHGRFW